MPERAGLLLSHLPSIYQRSESDLPELLAAFESVLFGPGSDGQPGLAQKIDGVPELLDANAAAAWTGEERPAFLVWLAKWVALSPLELFSADQLRETIPRIASMYPYRGTKRYLQELFEVLVPELEIDVQDGELPALVLGRSRVGRDSRLGGELVHWFYVHARNRPGVVQRATAEDLEHRIRALIATAKPAETAYQLVCEQIGAG